MSDFIEFAIKESNNKVTGKEFIEIIKSSAEPEDLQTWFKKHKYDITLRECIRLIEKKENYLHIIDTGLVKNY